MFPLEFDHVVSFLSYDSIELIFLNRGYISFEKSTSKIFIFFSKYFFNARSCFLQKLLITCFYLHHVTQLVESFREADRSQRTSFFFFSSFFLTDFNHVAKTTSPGLSLVDKRSNLISIINAISAAASELILEATRLANVRT